MLGVRTSLSDQGEDHEFVKFTRTFAVTCELP